MGIGEDTIFDRRAAAFAVAAIVEGKDRDSMVIAKLLDVRPQIGHAIAVAVAIEHYGSRIFMFDEPAVELYAIGRCELDLFAVEIFGGPIAFGVFGSGIEERVFEQQQHEQDQTIGYGSAADAVDKVAS